METKIKVFLEACIMQKGQEACAGSPILKGFISPFDAAVVEKLTAAGMDIEGRVGMDEFGVLEVTGENRESAGRCGKAADTDDVSGKTPKTDDVSGKAVTAYEVPGQGCGKAAEPGEITAETIKKAAADQTVSVLCNDIFGKIRRQAVMSGLSYLKPTYGTVSRYGLIPSASSMDQIGILGTNPADSFTLLSRIAGKDDRDGAMYPETAYAYAPCHEKIRMAFPENVYTATNQQVMASLAEKFEIQTITLKYYELYRQVLYILSCAEICNNTNRYDGIKFGYRTKNYTGLNDLYLNSRSEAFGADTKLAVIMGAAVLSQDNYGPYYEKAMKLRRLIRDSVNFDGYDIIALPAVTGGTPYEASALYALTALAGLPSLTIPLAGGGIQLIADTKREDILYGAWERIYGLTL